MYIQDIQPYYTPSGVQCVRRGDFLLLLQRGYEHSEPFRAVVRRVALKQFGHWMMGTARVGGESITVSGDYGSDGLPIRASENVYSMGIELPQRLRDLWKMGGGWNSRGSEAEIMKQWAKDCILGQDDPQEWDKYVV